MEVTRGTQHFAYSADITGTLRMREKEVRIYSVRMKQVGLICLKAFVPGESEVEIKIKLSCCSLRPLS